MRLLPAFLTAVATAVGAADSVVALPLDMNAATESYGALLAKYVNPDGVRYAAWRADAGDSAKLAEVVAGFEAADPAALSTAERYALYINLYNAKVLDLVVKGNPPKSVKELSKGINPYEIFKRKMLRFGGSELTLEELEAKLRKESNDPRVHFAVNCASRSCPPIAAEPYRGATLDSQLTAMTAAFLAKPGAVTAEEKSGLLRGKGLVVTASKIFDWYEDDFAVAGGQAAFLAKYAPAELASKITAAGSNVTVEFQDYDWNLNSAP